MLPDHTPYFFEYYEGGHYGERSADLDFQFGLACYVRTSLSQSLVDGRILYDPERSWTDYSGRFAVGAGLAVAVDGYVVVNVHGLWQGSIKTDTEAKIEQSKKIWELADSAPGKKIICGDFNLAPGTRAIEMFHDRCHDLIAEYGIADTRGPLYDKDVRYADFMFVDKAAQIKQFSVPTVAASDHLPLIVECE